MDTRFGENDGFQQLHSLDVLIFDNEFVIAEDIMHAQSENQIAQSPGVQLVAVTAASGCEKNQLKSQGLTGCVKPACTEGVYGNKTLEIAVAFIKMLLVKLLLINSL